VAVAGLPRYLGSRSKVLEWLVVPELVLEGAAALCGFRNALR